MAAKPKLLPSGLGVDSIQHSRLSGLWSGPREGHGTDDEAERRVRRTSETIGPLNCAELTAESARAIKAGLRAAELFSPGATNSMAGADLVRYEFIVREDIVVRSWSCLDDGSPRGASVRAFVALLRTVADSHQG